MNKLSIIVATSIAYLMVLLIAVSIISKPKQCCELHVKNMVVVYFDNVTNEEFIELETRQVDVDFWVNFFKENCKNNH
jgi:hypothetical protein